ncbi:class I SAM-dependent methyltransferase [Granulosicoccaceae sp. 1_MG-2023]|nr:class I SAM-dependent methyltransferase [Granulosicoccaceae sp. 1_MG-2023]
MEFESEKKFVEWSECITLKHPNVQCVAGILNARREEGQSLRGLDVGGGIGTFASHVCTLVPDSRITIIDKSALAREGFSKNPALNFIEGDFLTLDESQQFDFIIMKTVLHHFIGEGEQETRANQKAGLAKARRLLKPDGVLIVEENFYEDLFGRDLIGRLILFLTQPRLIEPLIRRLGANTAGEGVRFRSYSGWKALFAEAGFGIDNMHESAHWGKDFPLWQRLPLMCKRRFQAILTMSKAPIREAYPAAARSYRRVKHTIAAVAALSALAFVAYREAEA